MQGVCGVQEGGRCSRAVEGGDSLAGDVGTFADARKNQPPSRLAPFEHEGDDVVEIVPEPAFECANGLCFKAQGARRGITPGAVPGRRW